MPFSHFDVDDGFASGLAEKARRAPYTPGPPNPCSRA